MPKGMIGFIGDLESSAQFFAEKQIYEACDRHIHTWVRKEMGFIGVFTPEGNDTQETILLGLGALLQCERLPATTGPGKAGQQ